MNDEVSRVAQARRKLNELNEWGTYWNGCTISQKIKHRVTMFRKFLLLYRDLNGKFSVAFL